MSDGLLSNSIVKMIAAAPLTIHSDVTYTNNWLLLHEKSGHQTVSAPKDFIPEKYSLYLVIARQHLLKKLQLDRYNRVDGKSLYVSERLTPVAGDATTYFGEIFDAKFQSFSEACRRACKRFIFECDIAME